MQDAEPNDQAGLGEALAERVRLERMERSWSYERLSKELAGFHCKVAASSLHKIERGAPRRSISVDELFALADVFDTDVLELAQPASVHFAERARKLLERHSRSAEMFVDSRREDRKTVSDLREASRHLDEAARERVARDWVKDASRRLGRFEDSKAFEAELTGFLDPDSLSASPFAAAIDGDATRVPGYNYVIPPGNEDDIGIRMQEPPEL